MMESNKLPIFARSNVNLYT